MSQEYKAAADALRDAAKGVKSVKNAVYGVPKGLNISRIFAMVARTLGRLAALKEAVTAVPSLREATDSEFLLYIMLNDHLCGGGVRGGGSIKRAIVDNDAALRAVPAVKAMLDAAAAAGGSGAAGGGRGDGSSGATAMRRIVRVNTLRADADGVIAELTAAGHGGKASTAAAESSPLALAAAEIRRDDVIPTLLSLPADSHGRLQLHRHPLVASGRVILQDKASAFTAEALMRDVIGQASGKGSVAITGASAAGAGSTGCSRDALAALAARSSAGGAPLPFHAIDACAAPGNKTSQLAALLAEFSAASTVGTGGAGTTPSVSPRVFAFDRDPTRAQLLADRMTQAVTGWTTAPAGGASAAAGEGTSVGGKKRPRGAVAADGEDDDEHDADAPSSSASSSSSLVVDVYLPAKATATAPAPAGVGSATAAGKKHKKAPAAAAAAALTPEPLVTVACADFLSVDPHDPRYAGVRVVLLDPSCSGSGMRAKEHNAGVAHGSAAATATAAKGAPVEGAAAAAAAAAGGGGAATAPAAGCGCDRAWFSPADSRERDRANTLAAFQTRALIHALSFPSVRRVAYSTCSLWTRENEAVVTEALARVNASRVGSGDGEKDWVADLVPGILPHWHRRGIRSAPSHRHGLSDAQADACVRVDPRKLGCSRRPASDAGCATGDAGAAAAACAQAEEEAGMCGFFVAVIEKRPRRTGDDAMIAALARSLPDAAAGKGGAVASAGSDGAHGAPAAKRRRADDRPASAGTSTTPAIRGAAATAARVPNPAAAVPVRRLAPVGMLKAKPGGKRRQAVALSGGVGRIGGKR